MVYEVSDSTETLFCNGFCVGLIIPSYEYKHGYYHAFTFRMKNYVSIQKRQEWWIYVHNVYTNVELHRHRKIRV